MLLLRAAVAALRAGGHGVSVLAPSSAGAALVGPGGGEVDAVLPWEAAPMASLLSGGGRVAPVVRAALSGFSAVVAYTASAELAAGLGASGARVVTHPPLPPAVGSHASRWLAEAVSVLGADPEATPPVLQPTPSEQDRALPWLDRLASRFLAIHPGSGSPRKNWPADRFAAVVGALAAGRPFLLVEGPADGPAVAALAGLPGAVPARELTPRVLGAVLAHAGLYVGNDSGVSHLAAAFGAPTLALFGPTDPAVWAPIGPCVTVARSPDGAMTGLTVDEVVHAALENEMWPFRLGDSLGPR